MKNKNRANQGQKNSPEFKKMQPTDNAGANMTDSKKPGSQPGQHDKTGGQ